MVSSDGFAELDEIVRDFERRYHSSGTQKRKVLEAKRAVDCALLGFSTMLDNVLEGGNLWVSLKVKNESEFVRESDPNNDAYVLSHLHPKPLQGHTPNCHRQEPVKSWSAQAHQLCVRQHR